ncbi:MAG: hypothetical protein WAZ77_06320 [Candidatus Nitrosopolaris sp.]
MMTEIALYAIRSTLSSLATEEQLLVAELPISNSTLSMAAGITPKNCGTRRILAVGV